jgi:transposase
MRYELTDDEWSAIKPTLPNKPSGVPRVNDRRVLSALRQSSERSYNETNLRSR